MTRKWCTYSNKNVVYYDDDTKTKGNYSINRKNSSNSSNSSRSSNSSNSSSICDICWERGLGMDVILAFAIFASSVFHIFAFPA